MNISISKTNTQTLLTSGNERGNKANSLKSFPNRPDLGILLSVYYSDYDSHCWALSWIMEYCY